MDAERLVELIFDSVIERLLEPHVASDSKTADNHAVNRRGEVSRFEH